MANRKFNRFQYGTAVFSCRCCGRKSRETARNSGAGDICGPCFDLAGIENEISDGHSEVLDRKEDILTLTEEVAKAGGNLENWGDLLKLLGDAMNGSTATEPAPEAPACPPTPAVVPPVLTLHQSALAQERALKVAEYRSKLLQILGETQAALDKHEDSDRISTHDPINIGRAASDAHALAAQITLLDTCIVSCK